MTAPSGKRGPARNRTSPKQCSDQVATAGSNGTELLTDQATPGVDLLLARLEAVRQTSAHNWMARCPLHPDGDPSLSLTVKPLDDGKQWGLYGRCTSPTCRAALPDVIRHFELPLGRVLYTGNSAYARSRSAAFVAPLPTPETLGRWCEYLCSSSSLLGYVVEHRGLDLRTLDQWKVGYDEIFGCYTLPVLDEAGEVVNVRRYDPTGKPKMRNLPGHGKPARLYPHPPTSDDRAVVVAEGEWDALLARCHGLTAFSGTHGADTWLPEWSSALAGKHVAFIYDCDEAGREFAPRHADEVARFARSVRGVDLGLGNKEDLTDWFVTHGRSAADLRSLINATAVAGGKGGGRRG